MQEEVLAGAEWRMENDRPMAPDITLRDIVQHIQGLRYDMTTRMDRLEGRMNRLEGRMDGLEERMHTVTLRLNVLSAQVENIGDAVDRIEITMVEQKHEERIQKLEAHAGFRRR